MSSIRCPACGKAVDLKGNRCPACRTGFKPEFLAEWATTESADPQARKYTPSKSTLRPRRTGLLGTGSRTTQPINTAAGTEAGAPRYTGPDSTLTQRVDSPTDQKPGPTAAGVEAVAVTRRISRPQVVAGLMLLLVSAAIFSTVFTDNSGDSKSRRLRALENLLGETGSELLLTAVGLGAAIWTLATSRKTYTQASVGPSSAHCDLCGRETSTTRPAFLRVHGGFVPVPGAIRCSACDGCVREVGRLWRFAVWQIWLLLPGVIYVPLVLMFSAIVFFGIQAEGKESVRGAMLIMLAIAGALCVVVWWMQRRLSRRTSELLGTDLDGSLRGFIGLKKWGWPRRVTLSRSTEVQAGTPIIEASDLPSGATLLRRPL